MEERFVRAKGWLGAGALVALAIWLGMVALYAPIERVQGIVQKIFYVHVPLWPPAYLGFALAALGGAAFLWTRRESYDRLASAGAEVGVLFTTLMLVSGPLWAKPVWGHWWVWDLRLTLTLVLWFIYVAYLFLRAFAPGSDAIRSFASVYGIAGTAAIPFVRYAVELARGSSMHPSNPETAGLPDEMRVVLRVGYAAFLVVFAYLLAARIEVARLEARVDDLEAAS